jgi:hypothetical protein
MCIIHAVKPGDQLMTPGKLVSQYQSWPVCSSLSFFNLVVLCQEDKRPMGHIAHLSFYDRPCHDSAVVIFERFLIFYYIWWKFNLKRSQLCNF